jgi:hypothetical protein
MSPLKKIIIAVLVALLIAGLLASVIAPVIAQVIDTDREKLSALDQVQTTTVPDLLIIELKLSHIAPTAASRSGLPAQMGGPLRIEADLPAHEWEGKAELEVENTGSRLIKSVTWEFFLKVGAQAEQRSRRYRIESKKEIKPRQRAKVSAIFKNTSLKGLREPLEGQAEIKRITYADGKVWVPLKVRAK